MTEVFSSEATGSKQNPSVEKAGGISRDPRRDRLVKNYLFAPDEKTAAEALNRLTVDGRRAVIGGMTPEERARAAAVDELKERMPGLIRTGAVVSLSWVVGERLAEHFPNMRVALGSAGVGLFASGAAVETTYKLMHSRETMHSKVAVLAMSLAVLRPFARLAMEIGAGISGGVVTREVLDGFQAAAQQAGAGAGSGLVDPYSGQFSQSPDVRQLQQQAVARAPGGVVNLQSPDAIIQSGQAPAEQVGPQHPGVGQLPEGQGPAMIPPEERLGLPGDAEVLAQQAAAQAEAARQAALEAATRVVEVQPGDTLTGLIDAAGGNAYGKDFTNTVLQSADVLTGPQNPNRDMARALVEFIKAHPGGVNWRDAINGVGSLAKEIVGGVPLKDAMAQATRMIYPGQEIKVVIGAGVP